MSEALTPPLISVALCTYNGARFLREQLDSLLAQTYTNLEIIAVDDRSSDETAAILHEYAARDPRLRVTVNASNVGLQQNFQRALSLCSGDLIAPCDQDDVWLPQKLSTLFDIIGDRSMAYCDSEFIDENGHGLEVAMSDTCTMVSTDDPVIFAVANCVAGHAMLVRKQIVERALPVPSHFYYDWWLAAVAAATGGVVYCGLKLVRYRIHTQNATAHLRSQSVLRERGHRSTQLKQFRLRLESLARLPGKHRKFIERLRDLWRAREQQLFSPLLALFILKHGSRIFLLQRPRPKGVRHALRFMIGLRLKRVSNPHAYAAEDPSA